jgi:hypothetical protein
MYRLPDAVVMDKQAPPGRERSTVGCRAVGTGPEVWLEEVWEPNMVKEFELLERIPLSADFSPMWIDGTVT